MKSIVPLHNPKGGMERIEEFGDIGTRKTSDWLDIALWAQRTGADVKFYVTDTDSAVSYMLKIDDTYKPIENVVVGQCINWQHVTDTTAKFLSVIRPQDWLVIDHVSEVYRMKVEHYIRSVYGKSVADHYADVRKRLQGELLDGEVLQNMKPLSGSGDYQALNAEYNDWQDTFLRLQRCNVFMTAKYKMLTKKETDHILTYYGRIRFKPEGQKGVEGLAHTVIYKRFDGDNWYMTTIKDRGRRQYVTDKASRDFVREYLLPIAGWGLT